MKLSARIENAWLRILPTITRDYLWISVDGFRIYGSRRHHLMLYWLMKGKYERHTRKLFERALAPGMTVLDIGAHIGYFTLLGARAVHPGGRVYAFESDPSNFRFLEQNVALNGMGEVVTTIPKAVAEASGVRSFFADETNSLLSSLWKDGDADSALEVQSVAIDDYLDPHTRIDVIKIDVEGGELHVLRGLRDTLAAQDNVIMFLECNPTALASAGVAVSELLAELARLGLDVQVIDERQRRLTPVTSELTASAVADGKWYANLYCTRGVDPAAATTRSSRRATLAGSDATS